MSAELAAARVRLSWWGRVKAWLFCLDRSRALCSSCHDPMPIVIGGDVANFCVACEIGARVEIGALAARVRRSHDRSWVIRTIGRPDRVVTDHEVENRTPYVE